MFWFFIFGVLLASTGKPVSAACKLDMSPPTVMVKYGDSFTANCTSLNNESIGIGWESTYGGTGLQPGVSTTTLKIEDVKAWVIEPSCYVVLSDSTQCEETLPVTVYQMPESVSVSQPLSQTGPMVEGRQYGLQCDIVNVAPANLLTVYWHKGNKIIHKETFTDSAPSPVSKSSILNLTAHRDDNGLQILCEAKLNLGPLEQNHPTMQSKPREVTVVYPPTFINPENETMELSPGKKITLYCNATGNPAPVYSWHFPQPKQETSKNENVNQPFLSPSFQLPGTYSCKASSAQGSSIKYFTVIEATSSRPGTTAGILCAVIAVLIFVLGCVVYHKKRNSPVA